MALGQSARAAAWLERLGDRDADLVWATTYGTNDERLVVRHRGCTGFRTALRAFAAGQDDQAVELASRTRKAIAAFVSQPAFALLDAHTALLAAVARGEASSLDDDVRRIDLAWRQVFAQPGFELDVRVAIDFIASGVLAVAKERGIAVVSKPSLALPAGEPEWVRGLVVAERSAFEERAGVERTGVERTAVECPACGTAARVPSLRASRSLAEPSSMELVHGFARGVGLPLRARTRRPSLARGVDPHAALRVVSMPRMRRRAAPHPRRRRRRPHALASRRGQHVGQRGRVHLGSERGVRDPVVVRAASRGGGRASVDGRRRHAMMLVPIV